MSSFDDESLPPVMYHGTARDIEGDELIPAEQGYVFATDKEEHAKCYCFKDSWYRSSVSNYKTRGGSQFSCVILYPCPDIDLFEKLRTEDGYILTISSKGFKSYSPTEWVNPNRVKIIGEPLKVLKDNLVRQGTQVFTVKKEVWFGAKAEEFRKHVDEIREQIKDIKTAYRAGKGILIWENNREEYAKEALARPEVVRKHLGLASGPTQ